MIQRATNVTNQGIYSLKEYTDRLPTMCLINMNEASEMTQRPLRGGFAIGELLPPQITLQYYLGAFGRNQKKPENTLDSSHQTKKSQEIKRPLSTLEEEKEEEVETEDE